jgi:TolB-like protein/AraC-like DNA-binding protein/lipopolysaccharide biosynthesis regulator YciM
MNKEFLKKLTEIVEANLANEHFGPEELAGEMGMSHSNLHRKLKSISNQTLSQFIREIRLKKAKELLLNEDLTAAEISYRVGFGSPTYFNKCFHEYFGHAPGELRNHEQENEPEEQAVEIESTLKKPIRRKIWIVLIVCSFFLIPLSYFLITMISGSKSANTNYKSIAVLPFKYLGDEPEKQYLADGMMDAITSHLSKIKDIRVLSRTSVEQYRKTEKTAKVIGKELGVSYLLEGSLQKEGDKIRLIMQLIKTGEEGHAWSNVYDRPWKDIFSIQSDISETIASELDAVITPEEIQSIRKVPTTNITAYDFYAMGNYDLRKFKSDLAWTKFELLESAQISFRKSLELDSKFAQAYASLAETYLLKYNRSDISKKYLDSALILATQALVYDDRCADAYHIRGSLYRAWGKNEHALKEFEKAVKYNPNDFNAYLNLYSLNPLTAGDWIKRIIYQHEIAKRFRGPDELPWNLLLLGRTYLEFGFPDQALKYYKQSLELTHDSITYKHYMEFVEFSIGNFEKAYQLVKEEHRRDTTDWEIDIFQYCTFSGHHKEAYEYAKKYVLCCKKAGVPVTPRRLHRIGYAYFKAGKTEEAKEFFHQELENYLNQNEGKGPKNEEVLNLVQAADYIILGEKEKAFRFIIYNSKYYIPKWQLIIFQYDPVFDSIRSDPRFQKVLKAYEVQYQTKHDQLKKYLEENGYL